MSVKYAFMIERHSSVLHLTNLVSYIIGVSEIKMFLLFVMLDVGESKPQNAPI